MPSPQVAGAGCRLKPVILHDNSNIGRTKANTMVQIVTTTSPRRQHQVPSPVHQPESEHHERE